MTNDNAQQLALRVTFDGMPDQEINLRAYLFTGNGKLLASSSVAKEQVVFNYKGEPAQNVRVLIAPHIDDQSSEVSSISDLVKRKAYEPVLAADPNRGISILPIPEYYWRWWCWKCCRVRGRVVKDFTFNGVVQEKAICHARIRISEVDKICFWINRIPDHIIDRLKATFIDGPVHVGPGDPVEHIGNPAARNIFAVRPLQNVLPAVPREITTKFQEPNNELVRKAIVDHYDILRPYFCYWQWLYPYFFRTEPVATIYSDTNGYFDTSFLHFYCCHARTERFINSCCDSEPDLYFSIEYQINGIWTSVYKPCLPTHTFWNYACGTDITLRITDPRVPWGCHNQVEGSTVWVKSIGGGASVTHIEQGMASTNAPAYNDINFLPNTPFQKIGLSDAAITDSSNTYGDNRKPFGSTIRIIVQFGNAFPANGIKYYRWSYLKTATADLSATGNTTYQLIDSPEINKGYQFSYLDAGGVLRPDGAGSVKLGPVTVGTKNKLCFIPPNLLPGTAAPFQTNPAIEISPWWDYDTQTISFDTNTLEGDGLYDFKLELFDAAGNLVELPRTEYNIPVNSFPNPEWDGALNIWHLGQQAPAAYLVPGGTATNAAGYHMKVRIDNNAAEGGIAMIEMQQGDGTYLPTATNCCGFVQYDPTQLNNENLLKISFVARQTHNFADFGFSVQRSTCPNNDGQHAATDTAAMVLGSTNNGYQKDVSGVYSKTFSPATLLGSCLAEQKAAFAETLSVQPLAITGDGPAYPTVYSVAAFAIEPIAP